jgi:hypothetical protein
VQIAEADTAPPRPALFGRERELAEILRLVDDAAVKGGVLVVRGEAGIGETRLLEAASERAAALGVVTASAREAFRLRHGCRSPAFTNSCGRFCLTSIDCRPSAARSRECFRNRKW